MSEPFLGQLLIVGFNFAPRGWLNCDGQLLPINQYQALFSLYGTMYGGDGRQTFALPGLRGRAPIHTGQGPGLPDFRQGSKGGASAVVLNNTQIPSHHHVLGPNATVAVHGRTEAANNAGPNGNFLGSAEIYVNGQTAADATLHASSGELTGKTALNGGSRDHQNMQPYQVLRYVVAVTGIFPSRN